MSMLDDNIRRLLHYSTKERRQYMDAQKNQAELPIIGLFVILRS